HTLRAVAAFAFAMLAPAVVLADEAATLKAEKEIRAQYQQFTEAWNRHDADAIGKMWIAEGDHLEPDGRGVRGQESVAALFKEQLATVFKKTTLALAIDSVWLVTPDVALADGPYTLEGV